MQMRRWLALVLASSLVGCYVDPYTDGMDFPDDSSFPSDFPSGLGQADFRIDSLTGPSTLSPATQGQLQARLCNAGTTTATTDVTFFLSRDSIFDESDEWFATSMLTTVPAGSCRDVGADMVNPFVAEGTYVLMAVADPDGFEQERNESNNRRVGTVVRVGSSTSTTPDPSPYPHPDTGSDITPPAAPVIIQASWQYGTNTQGVSVKGSTEPGAEVGIFIDAQCTGTPAATVFAGLTGTFTAQFAVPTLSGATVRQVFVAARDAALNESACVEGPSYTTPCAAGYADCDGNAANGCEADLTEDADHCGSCGTICSAPGESTATCVAGSCGMACAVGRYDCDGNAANGCESTYACSPAVCTINRSAELAITALPVVEDPVRTAPGGAWSFGTLMRAMAGDQDPSAMVRQWLKTWATAQTVNGQTLPARTQMLTKVLNPWESKSGGASQPLDFSKAPFRLLAIMNRMDLRNPGVQAGEGRFVFGVLDSAGNPLQFTLILEYALPGGSPEAIQLWAHDWHELGQLAVGSAAYNAKLQALTDRFAKTGVMTGRPFGSALNQIRTNEIELANPWEMREFNLTETGLRPTTVKLTPDARFDNSAVLGDFIRANQAAILSGQYTVPDRFENQAFLGATAKVPEAFFWRAPSVAAEARHTFSLNTCSGCHAGETGTDFTHVAPRVKGQASVLSVFLRGGTVRDPVTQVPRNFDDLGRRATDLAALVCGTPAQGLTGVETFGGFPVPSNLPPARVH